MISLGPVRRPQAARSVDSVPIRAPRPTSPAESTRATTRANDISLQRPPSRTSRGRRAGALGRGRPEAMVRRNMEEATVTQVARFDGTSRRRGDGSGRILLGKRPLDHWPCSCPPAGVRPAEVGLCRRLTVPVVALDAGPKAVSRPATFRTRLPGGRRWARSPRQQWTRAAPGSGSSAMSESTTV